MACNDGKHWSMDELRVLTAIYFNSDFSIGDDARLECRLMADCFERDPPSIDRQWRNIAAITKGKKGYNVGQLVKDAVQDYLNVPTGSKKVARSIAENNGWKLDDLIVGEKRPKSKVDPSTTPLDRLSAGLSDMSEKLEPKTFKSGSQGFFLTGKVPTGDGARYQCHVFVTLIGSKKDPTMRVLATNKEVASEMRPIWGELREHTFKAGSKGFKGQGKMVANNQKFWVNVQAVRIGSK
jgi:hypothetical protein